MHISATFGSTFALTALGKASTASSGSSKRFIYSTIQDFAKNKTLPSFNFAVSTSSADRGIK